MTTSSAVPPALADLAAECGVATGYTDAHGVHREVSEATLRAVLAAMGVGVGAAGDRVGDDDAVHSADRDALDELRLRPWRRVVAPTVVARRGGSTTIPVHVPTGAIVSVTAHLEQNGRPVTLLPLTGSRVRRTVDGIPMERLTMALPDDLPTGWHRLLVVVDPVDDTGTTVEATLIVAPATLPLPAGLGERRAVGLAAQLYQLRSAGSWGLGDLADLAMLSDWAGSDLGADFVLVNPMHAAEPFPPVSPSPYLPTTRRFASPLYLRPEAIPEYQSLPSADRARIDLLAAQAAASNSADTIDRDASWSRKLEALRLVFSVPLSPERAAAFEDFTRREEPGLQAFATWCAIAREHGSDWSRWPGELQDVDSPAVARYSADHRDEVRFHQWLQWVTADQRSAAQQAAVDAGMRIGIIHDLAVGVHPTGADAWTLSRSLARGVSVGAPPDIYNQRGQDWSQPPLRPDALAETGYRAFRDIVRAVLRDAGGVRIDHILGLFRLWWIPRGCSPTEGTYVHYDEEAMLAVLALEASRAGAVVIGEDLGTVAPGVRETLAERGILGTEVMWFEREEDGAPRAPETYRDLCMASVTTHDLVPTAGYADLLHVDLRDRLGQLTRGVELEREDASAEVDAFLTEVRRRGLLGGDSPEDVVAAMHAFVAASPSVLFAVSVADLVAGRRPVNMPGTDQEYPNWRVPLSDGSGVLVGLEDLAASPTAVRVWGAAVGGQGQ